MACSKKWVLNSFFCCCCFRRIIRWRHNTAATGPHTAVAAHSETISVRRSSLGLDFSDTMKTSSQSPAPGWTALHQGVRVQLSFVHLEKQAFWFFAPLIRLTRTHVNTLLWSYSVFLHQTSSFLTQIEVFDMKSCMQKAHCEWITVPVINSFIFSFVFLY